MLIRDIVSIILYLFIAVSMILCSRHLVHILQLEGYKNKSFLGWIKHNFVKVYFLPIVFSLALIVIMLLLNLIVPGQNTLYIILHWMLLAACMILILYYAKKTNIEKAKKPLVFTGRVKRLFVYASLFYAGVAAGMYILDFYVLRDSIFSGALIFSILLFIGVGVPVANLIALPIEALVKKWYFNDAKRKLGKRDNIIKIGITGSFGKTSCKFILSTILSEKDRKSVV